jgi:hypothetical protein
MSGYTMTQSELLYAFHGAATLSVVSASAVTITAGTPEMLIPGSYMSKLGKLSSSLRLKMSGTLIVTAAVPTFSFGLEITSAVPGAFVAPSGGNILCATTATAPTATAGSTFFIDADIGLRTLSVGAASTVEASMEVRSPSFTYPYAGGGVVTTNTAWESDLQYFLWPYLTLGAATAGNTVQVNSIKLYGEN